jgi:hypothetical protein
LGVAKPGSNATAFVNQRHSRAEAASPLPGYGLRSAVIAARVVTGEFESFEYVVRDGHTQPKSIPSNFNNQECCLGICWFREVQSEWFAQAKRLLQNTYDLKG